MPYPEKLKKMYVNGHIYIRNPERDNLLLSLRPWILNHLTCESFSSEKLKPRLLTKKEKWINFIVNISVFTSVQLHFFAFAFWCRTYLTLPQIDLFIFLFFYHFVIFSIIPPPPYLPQSRFINSGMDCHWIFECPIFISHISVNIIVSLSH